MTNNIAKDFEKFVEEISIILCEKYQTSIGVVDKDLWMKRISLGVFEGKRYEYKLALQSGYKKVGGRKKRAYAFWLEVNDDCLYITDRSLTKTFKDRYTFYLKKNVIAKIIDHIDRQVLIREDQILTDSDKEIRDIIE